MRKQSLLTAAFSLAISTPSFAQVFVPKFPPLPPPPMGRVQDPATLPVADLNNIPLSGQWNSPYYAVTVFRGGRWRIANPNLFNLSGMYDCRPNDAQTGWMCQISENENAYKHAFIVLVTGNFKPKASQIKKINGADILIGTFVGAIRSGGLNSGGSMGENANDVYENQCRLQGKEPGNC